MATITKIRKGTGRRGGDVGIQSGRDAFFGTPVTVFASGRASPNKVQQLRDQLTQLTFKVEVVESEQMASIMIYHRGDVIFGNRLSHFIEYANWLCKQAP